MRGGLGASRQLSRVDRASSKCEKTVVETREVEQFNPLGLVFRV